MPGVGFETFFPKQVDTKFVVRNITEGTRQQKTIHIFQYPIPAGRERDLLSIPVVSEADIRHSLLKGELRIKALCGEIKVIASNIDLIQFDPEQRAFLESICITDGLTECPCDADGYAAALPYAWRQHIELVGTKDNVNRIFTTPDVFVNGTFFGHEFHILLRHNGRVLVDGKDYILSESGGAGTGYDTIIFTAFSPRPRSQLFADYVIDIT